MVIEKRVNIFFEFPVNRRLKIVTILLLFLIQRTPAVSLRVQPKQLAPQA